MHINLLSKPDNRYGFTAGHIGIIAACALFLMLFTWMQHDFRMPHFSKTSESGKALTYEEVRDKVLAQSSDNVDSSSEVVNQLAQVDGSVGGQVLGASTGAIDTLPQADSLFTEQILQKIPLKVGGTVTTESASRYLGQVRLAESLYGSVSMIAAMNATDNATLTQASQNAKNLAADVSQLTVPRTMETYARMKILYYVTLSKIADSFAAGTNDPQLSNQSVILFSLSQHIEQQEAEWAEKYNVE